MQVSRVSMVCLLVFLAEARVPLHGPIKIFACISTAIIFCKKSLFFLEETEVTWDMHVSKQ